MTRKRRSGALVRDRLSVIATMLALAVMALLAVSNAQAEAPASDWIEGHKNRVRLSAGHVEGEAPGTLTGFIEIEMAKGWKTYWRNPGSAGGIPPAFDFSQSSNVEKTEVLFPVPSVMSDQAGDVIGYKERVIFPVRIMPQDDKAPVQLRVLASYGICEKLCVPVDANLSLDLPPSPLPSADPDEIAAFEAVPRAGGALRPGDPSGFEADQSSLGSSGEVILSAQFPGGADGARIYLDVADGRYVPMPTQQSADGETGRFAIDLSNAEERAALKGVTVRVTLIGPKGHAEDSFVID